MDLLGVLYCLLISTSLGQAVWWDGFDTQEELSNSSVCTGPRSDFIDYRDHSVDYRNLSSRYPSIPYNILDQLTSAVGMWGLLYFESLPAWVGDVHSFSCVFANFQIPSRIRIQYFLHGGSFIEVISGGHLLTTYTNDCTTSCTPKFKEAIFPVTIDVREEVRIRLNTTTAFDIALIDDISFEYQDTPTTTATTTTTTSTPTTTSTTTSSTTPTTPSTTTTSTATTIPSSTMTPPKDNTETTHTVQTTTTSSQAITSTTESPTVTTETPLTTVAYTSSTELLKSTASIPGPGEATSTPESTSQATTTFSISTSTHGVTGDQDGPETSSTSPEFTSATDNSTAATTPDGASVAQSRWSLLLFSLCLYKLISSVSG